MNAPAVARLEGADATLRRHLAGDPWARLGPAGCDRLLALLAEPVRRVVEAGGVPFPNPVGLPPPSTAQERSHGG